MPNSVDNGVGNGIDHNNHHSTQPTQPTQANAGSTAPTAAQPLPDSTSAFENENHMSAASTPPEPTSQPNLPSDLPPEPSEADTEVEMQPIQVPIWRQKSAANKAEHTTPPKIAASKTKIPKAAGTKSAAPAKRGRVWQTLVFLFVFVVAMSGMVVGSGILGASAGQNERRIKTTATLSAYLVDRQVQCIEWLQKKNPILAEANCVEVLRYQPDNAVARNLLTTARVAQTPTNMPQPTLTPRPTAEDKEALFHLLQSASTREDWDSVIAYSDQIRQLYPNYELDAVNELRYDALVTRGLDRLRSNAETVEAGIFDLDLAEQIKPLSNAAQGARNTAVAYQTAISYFGADWVTAVDLLGELPGGYRDVGARLYEANVELGDALAASSSYCQAEIRYTDALSITGTSVATLETKLNNARTQCQLNPNGGLTNTAGLSGTTVFNVAGMSGRLIYSALEPSAGYNQLHLFTSGSNAVSILGGTNQPAYQPSAGIVALNGGSATYGLYSNGGLGTVANVGGLWPSISPDGTRIAYAVYENNDYQIYVAQVDGSTPPTLLTRGSWPIWGPGGRIALQTCTDSCGIHIINPDAPGELVRLTTSAGDINMQWSPNGSELIYASNYGGNFAIYRVSTAGGTTQLTDGAANASTPTWSPDGSRVAYESNRDGSWGIYIAGADGSNPQKLIDLGPNHGTWQSDRLAWIP